MFGGQLNPMDRPGAIGAGLSGEGIDLIKMHDAFLCPEGNPIAGHERHHQCDAKAENEPLHIPLLCRYGASTITPGASPSRTFTGYAGTRRAQEPMQVGSAVPGVTTTPGQRVGAPVVL